MFPQLNSLLAFNDIPMPAESVKHTKGDFWFPEQASVFAKDVDFLYYAIFWICLLYTSPSPRDKRQSRMPSSA